MKLGHSNLTQTEYDVMRRRVADVADRARCYLAIQQQVVLSSILEHFPGELEDHLAGDLDPVSPELIAELVDIRGGRAIVDTRHQEKQPDWTYNKTYSGTVPVERYANRRPPWGP